MTEYLIRSKGKTPRAHLWTGTDTVCRMWSTGGLQQSNYSVHSDRGCLEICMMCRTGREVGPRVVDIAASAEHKIADAKRWAEADREDDENGWEDRRIRIATAFSTR